MKYKFYTFFIISLIFSCASFSDHKQANMLPFDYPTMQPYFFPTTQPTKDNFLSCILQLQTQILQLKLESIENRIEIERLKMLKDYVPNFENKGNRI